MMTSFLSRLSLVIAAMVFPVSLVLAAASYNIELESANNDIRDKQSLQRGAVHFATYCIACHSAQYMRYNRVARDLGWTDQEVVEKLAFGQRLPVDHMMSFMQDGVSESKFGIQAPDLSLMSRLKGNDYIYTFLRGYYLENEGVWEPGNWNNKVLDGTSMPNVLEGIKKHSTPEEYDQVTRDLVNFLDYIAEPNKVERWDLGWKVILFLLLLLVLTYLLKREYWRDVKH